MHKRDMNNAVPPDYAVDKRADITSYRFITLFVFLSWVTLSITSHIEAIRDGNSEPAIQPWLTQFASHIVILLVMLIIPVLLTRFPLNRETWPRALGAFVGGFLIFSITHILLMVAIRKLLWPVFFGGPYIFGLSDPINWLYEMQKDAYTFLLQISVFWFARLQARQSFEAEGRKQEAKESGRLTLISGGRISLVNANDVRLAKAAANYVDIHTPHRDLLVRMTLRELEQLLATAADNHIRIHRSCIVHMEEIADVKPNGDGSATITLINGNKLQASRSHRSMLEKALLGRE